VLASITRFLETKLKLRVNREKSASAHVSQRKFLGYRLLSKGKLGIAPKSLERAKERIREITRRNRGVSLERMISELNSFTSGWVTYFRLAQAKSHMQRLDERIRRKLRCVKLKQLKKRRGSMARFFISRGVDTDAAKMTGASGKGWWRLSGTRAAAQSMSLTWFDQMGLQSLSARYLQLNGNETAACDNARAVV